MAKTFEQNKDDKFAVKLFKFDKKCKKFLDNLDNKENYLIDNKILDKLLNEYFNLIDRYNYSSYETILTIQKYIDKYSVDNINNIIKIFGSYIVYEIYDLYDYTKTSNIIKLIDNRFINIKMFEYINILEYLIHEEIDVNESIEKYDKDIITMLINYGVNVHSIKIGSFDKFSNKNLLKLFQKFDYDFTKKDENNNNLLHLIFTQNYALELDFIKYLVEDVNILLDDKNNDGLTPFDLFYNREINSLENLENEIELHKYLKKIHNGKYKLKRNKISLNVINNIIDDIIDGYYVCYNL